MYGLKKENKKFDFDLEVEIKKNPKRKQELLEDAKAKASEIKKILQAQEKPDNFEELGILLNGYDALEKVIAKIK
jgi:hypothetical protein